MKTIVRAAERSTEENDRRETARTFSGSGFGRLERLDEHQLSVGARVPGYADSDSEIITYVRSGALAYRDSMGHSGLIRGGELERVSGGRRARRGERNAMRREEAHVFHIGLRSSDGREQCHHEQKRFSVAERRGGLCAVASPDARRGSLLLVQDVVLYSAMLGPGQHVVHELAPGRSAWLHVVEGEIRLADVALTTGDGAGVTLERALSMTAHAGTEILLLDLGAH
jgi:redox-sensitive bicupin YhaK (pirin superfamily)